MRVVCVKWGTLYGPEYVHKLHNMVARHLPIPHEFVCMTERPLEGLTCIPLACEYEGWWQKIGLFRPGLLPGDNLYLDLDVVITDSLLPLAALLYESPGLWARDDFSYSLRNPRRGLGAETQRLLGGPGTVNSSVMLWKDDTARVVWDTFTPAVMGEVHGDQNHLSRVLWPDGIRFIPDPLVNSYKYHVLRGEPPAPVVVFHGEPKPHQVGEEWVRNNWR